MEASLHSTPKDGLSKDVAYAGNTEGRCKIKFVRWQHKINIADDSDNGDDDDDEGGASDNNDDNHDELSRP